MSERPGQGGAAQAPEGPEDIEARLRAQRETLAASVDELAARVDPRTRARLAGEDLRGRADAAATGLRDRAGGLADRARQVVEDARAGDSEMLTRVAAAAGGALAVSLIVARLLRR